MNSDKKVDRVLLILKTRWTMKTQKWSHQQGSLCRGVQHTAHGRMRPRTAMNMAQHPIINYLKLFFAQFSLVFVYLMCGRKQLFFFQCGPETPKRWTPREGRWTWLTMEGGIFPNDPRESFPNARDKKGRWFNVTCHLTWHNLGSELQENVLVSTFCPAGLFFCKRRPQKTAISQAVLGYTLWNRAVTFGRLSWEKDSVPR